MKRFLLPLLLAVLATLQVSAYKKQSIDIKVNGQNRNMVVFTPNTLPARSPLLIVTHGMNQDPEYQYGSDKIYEMIDTAKFVVTYLRSDGSTWDIGGTKDQTFVSKTIDEMSTRFDIDKNRVYWSGFSMGSMLIHHCIANMQNKIAAFAPTSGIQFSEQPWNNCKKPVNLLECIAYGDGVFGYEEYNIHSYIESYAKHDKHPNYVRTKGYKPIASSWYDGDLEKWTGGTNGGEVWLYSYNNGGHWPMDLNRHLIWNFLKRFSLNPTAPKVKITQPAAKVTHVILAPKGEATFPDIEVRATASDPNGKVAKVEFLDNKKVFETLTALPWTATLTAPAASRHNLSVVATDNDGETSQASCQVTYTTSALQYNCSQAFTTEDVVPWGWRVSDSKAKRNGSDNTCLDGPRILRFTNTTRAFDYGLMVKSEVKKERGSWAKFGTKEAASTITLHAGRYALKYKLCNWNQPEFSPVTVCIERRDGSEVASESYMPTVNIGGKVGNKFSKVAQQVFQFDIDETGDYVIAFYADSAKGSDFVLGQLTLQAVEFASTGISDLSAKTQSAAGQVFDLSGRAVSRQQLRSGIYVIDGRKRAVK